MTAPRPLEVEHLAPSDALLDLAVASVKGGGFEARLQILEACSARFGGFDLAAFHKAFRTKSMASTAKLMELAAPVAAAIERSPIHPALALSALAREALDEADRKTTGAYHTDFRLATRLAGLAAPRLTSRSKVVDAACGAGILLAALSVAVCGRDRAKLSEWLAFGVCAADLSANSLRATLLSLASLTDDLAALVSMRSRWMVGDSLLADAKVWRAMAPDGFDAVVGNPPWEKVKLSRHEFLKANGAQRHYGADTVGLDQTRFDEKREEVADYSRLLLDRYPELGRGEPDLYVAFTTLFFDICKPGGVVAALLPGGLIRSQGTEAVRRRLIDSSQSVTISIIDNRTRFFAIDSRFKFLAVALVKAVPKAKREPIVLSHERGSPTGTEVFGEASIGRAALAAVRPDLSIPEVRSQAEWRTFLKVAESGCSWTDPIGGWDAKFSREVDMTNQREDFLSSATATAVPLVEGRMVHHHRFGVKGYAGGSGRRAIWEANSIGDSSLRPQFWIEPTDLAPASLARMETPRAGFCDIAGQTNERSLMASMIPAGVACGNKVPTVLFPDDPSPERLLAWVAIVNSFPFDWMLRRVLTTTVNYFLLQSIPLPRLARGGLPWRKLAASADELRRLDTAGARPSTHERMAQLRAEIDAEVAVAYGLSLDDMELMLSDFPILDRGQPALPGEARSTITRDTVLSAASKRTGVRLDLWAERVHEARRLGARAYVPSEIAGGDEGSETTSGANINDKRKRVAGRSDPL